eukprot:scaffold3341_cov153-Isochrysis_galbana.AAC.6
MTIDRSPPPTPYHHCCSAWADGPSAFGGTVDATSDAKHARGPAGVCPAPSVAAVPLFPLPVCICRPHTD